MYHTILANVTLPGIKELLQEDSSHSVPQLMKHQQTMVSPAFVKVQQPQQQQHAVLQHHDDVEDSCPSSPMSSPSSSEATSPECMLSHKINKGHSQAVVMPLPLDANNKRRRNTYDADEAWTDEEDKPKKSRASPVPVAAVNGSTAVNGPKYAKGKGKNKGKLECEGDKCSLCKTGAPYYLHKSMNPGWRETVLAVFEYFPKRITESEWRKQQGLPALDLSPEELQNEQKWLFFPDAYAFLEYHWELLCPPQHRNRTFVGTNWRKTIQDTLSHNRTFFISGKEIFGKTGFWRLAPKAPSTICANILNESKHSVDYNIHSEGNESPASDFTNYSFDALLKGNAPVTAMKEETRDTPMENSSARPIDFSKFDLLVAAIDHLENLKEDN